MSKGRWIRCPITGLTKTQLDQLPDEYLNREGRFNILALPDCNVFDVRTIAAVAGWKEHRYFSGEVLGSPSSSLNTHKVRSDINGSVLLHATHMNSADWGGRAYRAEILATQTGYRSDHPTLFEMRSCRSQHKKPNE
jgi:hypothetical protein